MDSSQTSIDKKAFYSRQTTLNSFSLENLKKLNEAKVLVIGLGGLGCPLCLYLVNSGVENLTLVDGDIIDPSNLARQTLYLPENVGEKKVKAAAQRLRKQNPFAKINAYEEMVDFNNIKSIVNNFDLVVDCTDNFETKFLIHDACFELRKNLVIGSVYQWNGWIKSFSFNKESSSTPCLRCLWEDVVNDSCIKNCSEVGILPSTCLVIASYMTNEIVKILIGEEHLENGEDFLIDLLHLNHKKIKWSRNPRCRVCSNEKKPLTIEDYFKISAFEKTYSELKKMDLKQWVLIDIRKVKNDARTFVENNPIFSQFDQIFHTEQTEDFLARLSNEKNILLMCHSGKTSYAATKDLMEKGFKKIYSLKGGAERYSKY